MGKRIDDLKLDDTPIEQRVEAPDEERGADIRDQPWYQLVGEIDELLDDDRYAWAYETLTGIKETAERTRRVSEGQRRAVDNILAAKQERRGGWGRRYEGWGR